MTLTMRQQNLYNMNHNHNNAIHSTILLEVKLNFKFKKGVEITIKSKETSR